MLQGSGEKIQTFQAKGTRKEARVCMCVCVLGVLGVEAQMDYINLTWRKQKNRVAWEMGLNKSKSQNTKTPSKLPIKMRFRFLKLWDFEVVSVGSSAHVDEYLRAEKETWEKL